MLATVALSLVLSLFLGNKEEFSKTVPLSSPTFLRLWARLRLLPDEMKQPGGEAIGKSDDDWSSRGTCYHGSSDKTIRWPSITRRWHRPALLKTIFSNAGDLHSSFPGHPKCRVQRDLIEVGAVASRDD
ncbi:hypothetical protein MTO96_024143 [Rhipicephalus appendiculatus]